MSKNRHCIVPLPGWEISTRWDADLEDTHLNWRGLFYQVPLRYSGNFNKCKAWKTILQTHFDGMDGKNIIHDPGRILIFQNLLASFRERRFQNNYWWSITFELKLIDEDSRIVFKDILTCEYRVMNSKPEVQIEFFDTIIRQAWTNWRVFATEL